MTSASIVLGVLEGLLIGMLAVGIVLVYRSSRFLNLAHGRLGALSAPPGGPVGGPAVQAHFAHMEDASATAIETGSTKPGKSLDKTLLITTIQTGAAHTPGYLFNPPTQECTEDAGLGRPPVRVLRGGCLAVRDRVHRHARTLFKLMAEAAPSLTRTSMLSG